MCYYDKLVSTLEKERTYLIERLNKKIAESETKEEKEKFRKLLFRVTPVN